MSFQQVFFVGGMSLIVLGLPTFLVAMSIYTASSPRARRQARRQAHERR